MRQYTLLSSLILLAVATSAQQTGTSVGQRSRLDTMLPAYPVDAAACAAFNAPNDGGLSIQPYAIKGIAPLPGQKIWAAVYPDTPFFEFFVNHFQHFWFYPIAFPLPLQCMREGTFGDDGNMRFTNIGPGKYFVLVVKSSSHKEYGAWISSVSGTDTLGVPVTGSTSTPTETTVQDHTIYGALINITPQHAFQIYGDFKQLPSVGR